MAPLIFFTETDLERLAGPARFERGRCLVDAVDDLYEDEWVWLSWGDGPDGVCPGQRHGPVLIAA